MEEYHQITITEYLTWKQEIKDRLNTTVDNFIVIGYRLKQIRDSEAYRNDGYPSMGAFVQAEYGLNEATASKFIKINDNYSEGGNSMRLQEKYKGYGYNKLYEMIALPESDRELITTDTSVKEIREIKQFNKESEQTPAADADEEKLLKLLLTDNQEAFDWIMSGQETEHMEDILYAFAPSGSRMIRQGTMMLFLQSEQEGIKIKRFGAGQQQMSYTELFERIRELFTGRETELFPEKEEFFDVEKEERNKPVEKVEDIHEDQTGTGADNCSAEPAAEIAGEEGEEDDGYCETVGYAESGEDRNREPDEAAGAAGDSEEETAGNAGTDCEVGSGTGETEEIHTESDQSDEPPAEESTEEKEKIEVIAPAQKFQEIQEKNETVTNCHRLEANEAATDCSQLEETVTDCNGSEPEQQEKTMTRYEYMQDLTEAGLASYLFHNVLKTARTVKDMKNWLHQTVDAKGREY